ncbi:PREDICTED: uncharacterized protein LOC108377238 [Rhagoletis zephyria]|uniref:uncharacterized protein LOC108377238 n=1 Tax=Rhagoletis zephyria TaxID=28612 RepID=UPI0008112655|nr:PREDICTED: uncharacterized protein LOC108377238 [Rhagoletis zephyria]
MVDNDAQASLDGKPNLPNTADDGQIMSARVVKLPPFWKDNCILWFAQVEAALDIAQIRSDGAKYKYVLVHLDETALPFVADIITSPPDEDKYAVLKERLISTFEDTEDIKLRRLLQGLEYIEGKPSRYLQRLRNLVPRKIPDEILRTIFLERLPSNIRCVLAISATQDLTTLALQADKIFDAQSSIMTIHKTDKTNSEPPMKPVETISQQNSIDELRAEIHALSKKINSSKVGVGVSSNDKLCYYHLRFGSQARKCRQPCEFKNSKNNSGN